MAAKQIAIVVFTPWQMYGVQSLVKKNREKTKYLTPKTDSLRDLPRLVE
jgi:hypothetical protein